MKKIWGLIVAILLLSGFLLREYQVTRLAIPIILAEENVVLLRVSSERIFGMGNLMSPRARALSRSLLSFFALSEIYNVWEIAEGKELRGADFVVQRVSDNLVRSVCAGEIIWWIGDDFSGNDRKAVVQAGVVLDSEWWIMQKNRLPDFLPLPTEGILYAGDRSPSKKTKDFAETQKIPLISVKETNGLMLKFVSSGSWELSVRD